MSPLPTGLQLKFLQPVPDLPSSGWMHEVFQDPAQHKKVSGGRGIRKTTFAYQWLTVETLRSSFRGTGVYTAPTFRQAKRIVWKELLRWLDEQPVRVMVGKNDTELVARLIDGKELMLIGMDEFEGLRGIHPVAAANDEKARSKQRGFEEVLDPALANHRAKTLDITTPKRGWWQREWEEGWGPNRREDTRSWKIRTEDVGTVPAEELERQRRRLPPTVYAQEWEGEFTGAEGPIFPEFVDRTWPEGHLVPPGLCREEMEKGGYPLGSLDWGFSGRTVKLWGWITRSGGVIFLDLFMASNARPWEVTMQAKRKRPLEPRVLMDSKQWTEDQMAQVSVTSIAQMFRAAGMPVIKADKRFQPSIERMRDLMVMEPNTKFPRFAIMQGHCEELVSELIAVQEEHLRPGGGGFRDKCLTGIGDVGRDPDCVDAARYLVMGARANAARVRPGRRWSALPPLRRRDGPGVIVGYSISGRPLYADER